MTGRILRLQQGSPDWHDWRSRLVTASDIAAIAGVSPYPDHTRDSVLALKLDPQLGREENFAMRRGRRLEPVARVLAERRLGKPFPACCVAHPEVEWAGASLDGLSADGEILELKCPNRLIHDGALCGFVPPHYFDQIQWQLWCSGAERARFVSFTDNAEFAESGRLAVVEVLPDPERMAALVEVAEEFVSEVREKRAWAEMNEAVPVRGGMPD